MARTYRLRHCPSLPGTAKHFAFTSNNSWRRREDLILNRAKALFPEIFKAARDGNTWNRWLVWRAYHKRGDARSILDTLEGQIIVPLMSPHAHPWRRHYGINLRIAKYYRRWAHKNIRRISKHLLNKAPVDFDEVLMPAWYEHWDRWDIT